LKSERLKSGFTTGACSASSAKSALEALIKRTPLDFVEIPFPDGSRHTFKIHRTIIKDDEAFCSVIKDAGDDPDVTNGAEICAKVRFIQAKEYIIIKGGEGVGIVTKPGLAVKVGEPAINPVPRQMIKEAISEVPIHYALKDNQSVEVTISITRGEELSRKTLNYRLGIVGGLSVLGTTGIVRPLSVDAWTATIKSSMNVAKALNRDEIVLSSGRTSEKAHMTKYHLPEECYVMMGDYIDFAFNEAQRHNFKTIHLCAQWAKMIKIAMGNHNTHVRFGVIDIQRTLELFNHLWIHEKTFKSPFAVLCQYKYNTLRELFEKIISLPVEQSSGVFEILLRHVAKIFRDKCKHKEIIIHLITYDGKVISY